MMLILSYIYFSCVYMLYIKLEVIILHSGLCLSTNGTSGRDMWPGPDGLLHVVSRC